MTDKDPLTGSDSSPVPPTARPAIPLGALPHRHAADEVLVTPTGAPIPPVDPVVNQTGAVTELTNRVTALEQLRAKDRKNYETGILITIGIAILALALAVLAGLFVIIEHKTITDLEARLTGSDVERARVDGTLRDAQCITLAGQRASYSTEGRDAFPGGTGRYEALYVSYAQAAAKLNCDAS